MKWPAWNIAWLGVASLALAQTPQTHVIVVENMAFQPASLTVNRGDSIVWVNKDLFPHTATAESRVFDSREIAPQASWTYVAAQTGDYRYVCAYHPTMKAQITIR